MAYQAVSNVGETSTTGGTGDLDLEGAIDSSFQAFSDDSDLSNTDDVVVGIFNKDTTSEWEIGRVTYNTGTPDTISRTDANTIKSSNGGNRTNFTTGDTLHIEVILPGERAVQTDLTNTFSVAQTFSSGLTSNGDVTLGTAGNSLHFANKLDFVDESGSALVLEGDGLSSTESVALRLRQNREVTGDQHIVDIMAYSNDSAGNDQVMGELEFGVNDSTNGAEDTWVKLFNYKNGTFAARWEMDETAIKIDHELRLNRDNDKLVFGAGQDAALFYDGSDQIYDSRNNGSGGHHLKGGNVRVANNLKVGGLTSADDSLHVDSGGVRIEDNSPAIRLKESDTTDTNYEILVGGGNLFVRTQNDVFGSPTTTMKLTSANAVEIQTPNATTGTTLVTAGSGLNEIQRSSSTRRHKTHRAYLDAEDIDPQAVLQIQPSLHEYDEAHGGDLNHGFYAEQWADLIPHGIEYDEDGKPAGWTADAVGIDAAQQVVLQDHESRIEQLEQEVL